MTVGGIEAATGAGFTSLVGSLPTVEAPTAPTGPQGLEGTQGAQGVDFKSALTRSIDGLEGLHDTTDKLAVQAATGDLGAIHQYTLAATEMSVATQLTVAVRNKAVEAFNEIMRMQV
ncbi:flagellar hook-basal body complex protein FliE [Nocardioides marmoribigeumensis]|jgi:flagellar hook-basal body complex protein FliE|uniref:Flagellar hook-basal body complex protein FliE n=1 Tax=Nocardioides marmoribigeumensis TaxID=433649 RepID=A0ABU2BTX8_9ACTN|nr:flagellar hook-basal body complex protein FliE [Nocardioides marmoribigeumensis]MDR7362067.1 flagellar hook-basal body complex protein FliE [Nocardioides marmoribigeumensis]